MEKTPTSKNMNSVQSDNPFYLQYLPINKYTPNFLLNQRYQDFIISRGLLYTQNRYTRVSQKFCKILVLWGTI